jgi:hypothetical protein
VNNGSLIHNGSEVNLNLNFTNNNDSEINNGVFNIKGNWYNNGDIEITNDNLIRFENTNVDQIIGGTNITAFESIEIAKSIGTELLLDINTIVSKNAIMNAGNFKLNQMSLDLGTTGDILNEEEDRRIYCVCPTAFIRKEVIINHPFTGNPGNLGLELTTTGVSLGSTIIKRRHREGLNNSVNPATVHRSFDVTPSYNENLNLELVFHYFQNEFKEGIEVEDAQEFKLYRSTDGVNWFRQDSAVADAFSKTVSISGWNQFSEITAGGPNTSTLPIKLSSFNVDCGFSNEVNISWETSTEINNDFFTIERSLNGTDFKDIGIIYGAGNSNVNLAYSFTDYRIEEFNSKTIYYRLKQTDFD